MKLSVTITGQPDFRRLAAALAERLRQDIERDLQPGIAPGLIDAAHQEVAARSTRRLVRS
jgi:hypothetical protein